MVEGQKEIVKSCCRIILSKSLQNLNFCFRSAMFLILGLANYRRDLVCHNPFELVKKMWNTKIICIGAICCCTKWRIYPFDGQSMCHKNYDRIGLELKGKMKYFFKPQMPTIVTTNHHPATNSHNCTLVWETTKIFESTNNMYFLSLISSYFFPILLQYALNKRSSMVKKSAKI